MQSAPTSIPLCECRGYFLCSTMIERHRRFDLSRFPIIQPQVFLIPNRSFSTIFGYPSQSLSLRAGPRRQNSGVRYPESKLPQTSIWAVNLSPSLDLLLDFSPRTVHYRCRNLDFASQESRKFQHGYATCVGSNYRLYEIYEKISNHVSIFLLYNDDGQRFQ